MNTYIDRNGHFSKDAGSVVGDTLVNEFSILSTVATCSGETVEQALTRGLGGYAFPCAYDWVDYKAIDAVNSFYRIKYVAKSEDSRMTADSLKFDAVRAQMLNRIPNAIEL